MQYSAYDAIRAGFDKIVFVIKKEHEELVRSFCADIKGIEICFAYQDFSSIKSSYTIPADRVKPFGTVHAVLSARELINEPFAIINADDFYGADAFGVIFGELQNLRDGVGTMVSYKLKNTVSKSGAVTRGVCEISDGKLVSVKETYSITVDENRVIKDKENGVLDSEAKVSMNMWGFLPSVFDIAEREFSLFLDNIAKGDIKAEFALPTLVDKAIRSGELDITVLTTESVWFGVTYKEDRPLVKAELTALHESGAYPKKLF